MVCVSGWAQCRTSQEVALVVNLPLPLTWGVPETQSSVTFDTALFSLHKSLKFFGLHRITVSQGL
jgi:hypothetical protein